MRQPAAQALCFAVALAATSPATAPGAPISADTDLPAGLRLFLATGCGACHRIAGTEADGEIGPELSHFAARETIGANLLPMSRENALAWITHTQALKPGARMPAFDMLPKRETAQIVDYLMTLK
jgi:cytochrome c oxidase subunit II